MKRGFVLGVMLIVLFSTIVYSWSYSGTSMSACRSVCEGSGTFSMSRIYQCESQCQSVVAQNKQRASALSTSSSSTTSISIDWSNYYEQKRKEVARRARLDKIRKLEARHATEIGYVTQGVLAAGSYPQVLKTIDELIYEQRYDFDKMRKLKALRQTVVTKQKEQQKIERAQAQDKINEARQRALGVKTAGEIAVLDRQSQEMVEAGVQWAMEGLVPTKYVNMIDEFADKILTKKDRESIERALDELDEIIMQSIEDGADLSIIAYLESMEDTLRSYIEDTEFDIDEEVRTALDIDGTDINLEIAKYKIKRPVIDKDALLDAKKAFAAQDMNINKATWDAVRIMRIDARSAVDGEDTVKRALALERRAFKQDTELKRQYLDILEKYPDDPDANFGMSEIYDNQQYAASGGDVSEEARYFRMRAFLHATPEKAKEMKYKAIERYANNWAYLIKPSKETSMYLQNVDKQLRDKLLPDIDPSEEYYGRALDSEKISTALAWRQAG